MIIISNPRFYLLRLRISSLSELVGRLQQYLKRFHLNFINLLGPKNFDLRGVEADALKNLIVPDLHPVVDISFFDINNLFEGMSSNIVKSNKLHERNKPTTDTAFVNEDIRIVWEPARLQQAVVLLACADRHPDIAECEKAGEAVRNMILSWLAENPFPIGVHYQSAMECALRVPVFFYALKRLNNLTSGEYDRISKAIYLHGWLISKKLSLYSSLGNHTIAEAVGLIFAGAVYRSTRRGKEWLETGIRLLNDESAHQILDDGGPAEQSLSYHRFVLDLYWLAMDFIQKNNLGNVHHWQKRLVAGEFFLETFKDQNRLLPAIGDSDDGCAVAPGLSPRRIAGVCESENPVTFPDSGYTIIRNDNLTFTFDHGPLGMAPLYNHGHADALSITLSKNGHPFLADPGTYRYNGVPQWRKYFKGTRSHNTVTIDDQDQAIQETGFIWSKPYHAKLKAAEVEKGRFFFSAVHDGYTRLKDPVRHYRTIVYFDQANFLIRDSFSGTGNHQFQLNFHLHPDVTIGQAGKWWVLENAGEYLFIKLLNGYLKPVKGAHDPIMGWFSSYYGEKEPTTVLTFTKNGIPNQVIFLTAIFTQPPFNHNQFKNKAGQFEGKIKNS